MIWFVVWTVLVLGALVVIALLLRRLWRQAVALGRQLAEASEVLARLADQVEALQATSGRDPDLTAPTLFDDPEVLRARLAALRDSAAGRRAERAERATRTAAGWRAYWS
jgi:biopolymer transport protein ExbB/TolQ